MAHYFKKNKKIEHGLSKGESKYRKDMIKGRIAETLIEELFLALEFDVFRYGLFWNAENYRKNPLLENWKYYLYEKNNDG